MALKLYSYFRSSAAYRVRIASGLKGLDFETVAVNIFPGVDEQTKDAYKGRNPEERVPFFEDGSVAISQSMAMLEYLEDVYPDPATLPKDPVGKARVRSIANQIACDIHPLNNLSVLRYLKGPLGHDQRDVDMWYSHWIVRGLTALETQLTGAPETGTFCHGDIPTLADICLVPQLWNARRFKIDLSGYPTLVSIDNAMMALKFVQNAAPEAQPDAPTEG